MTIERRVLLKGAAIATTAMVVARGSWAGTASNANTSNNPESAMYNNKPFSISLAQWSLHKSFFGDSLDQGWGHFTKSLLEDPDSLYRGPRQPEDFPAIAKGEFGIDCIELVNTFYYSKADDTGYWQSFKQRCDDLGVSVGLIMCDALGNTGDRDASAREETLRRHHNWVDIAKTLGAHSIRVNAAGQGSAEEVAINALAGLKKLTDYGASQNVNIIVENHGGYYSNGQWLAQLIAAVDSPHCGTLPDFGNFCMETDKDGCAREYDRYLGIEELLPYAKGISAKTYDFDEQGKETLIDFERIAKLAQAASYRGAIGIEYEGSKLTEFEGIKATQALLKTSFNIA